MLRVVILCLFICLCCCHPHQIQSPAALTRLETTHKIRLSLTTPPRGFTCTILKTSFPSTVPMFIPYNQFVGHFVKQILLVFQSCLVTLCLLLHNPPTHFLPSSFLCHFQSLLVFLTLHCPVWATAGLFLRSGLPVTGLPTLTAVFLTFECCIINKALRSLQFLSSLYKSVSEGALEAYFTVVGAVKFYSFLVLIIKANGIHYF